MSYDVIFKILEVGPWIFLFTGEYSIPPRALVDVDPGDKICTGPPKLTMALHAPVSYRQLTRYGMAQWFFHQNYFVVSTLCAGGVHAGGCEFWADVSEGWEVTRMVLREGGNDSDSGAARCEDTESAEPTSWTPLPTVWAIYLGYI